MDFFGKMNLSTVLDSYLGLGLNVIGVDAADKFLDELEGSI